MNVTVSSQTGLPSFLDTWMTQHEQHGLIFVFSSVVYFTLATTDYWVEFLTLSNSRTVVGIWKSYQSLEVNSKWVNYPFKQFIFFVKNSIQSQSTAHVASSVLFYHTAAESAAAPSGTTQPPACSTTSDHQGSPLGHRQWSDTLYITSDNNHAALCHNPRGLLLIGWDYI